MKKQILMLVTMLAIACVGCSDDVMNQVTSIAQAEDSNILAVKGGSNPSYPGVTYEAAFEQFFASPTWTYFVGEQEGPDDDGDGNPDYVNTNVDVVEFTGNCMYADVEVKALIQFVLDLENGTFDAAYLAFNDVPQSQLMLAGLLDVVFSEAVPDTTQSVAATQVQQEAYTIRTSDVQREEKKEETKKVIVWPECYEYMEQFLEVVKTYYPEDLIEETDADYEQHCINLYLSWVDGFRYKNIGLDSYGNVVMKNTDLLANYSPDTYSGEWMDMYSQRCHMTITCLDYLNYTIDIYWGNSAWETGHWVYYGTYDPKQYAIVATGSFYNEYTSDAGVMQATEVYSDGIATFYMQEGYLMWYDYKENAGAQCFFERTSY